jgi:dsDNA-specific endonuclease/ATPase MutS2
MIFDFLLRPFRKKSGDRPEPEEEADAYNPFPEPVVIEIRDVIDLHSIPPRHVKAAVEEYLEQARGRGFRNVRIIHGKGQGIQREVVRSILKRTPFVIDFQDAPPDYGGWGATVVTLDAQNWDPE